MKYYLVGLLLVCGYLFFRYSLYEGFANAVGANAVGANAVGADAVGANVIGANVIGANVIGANAVSPLSLDLPAGLEEITGHSFCSLYVSKPQELNAKCSTLTEQNCNATSCCVWLNGASCVAGDANGPTFRTKAGKDIDVKYYAYKNSVMGKK